MNRRDLLGILGAATLGAPAIGADDAPQAGDDLKGVPRISVEQLRAAIRREGFQWRHIGHQITFTASVMSAGGTPRVRIDGMDEGRLDTAWLHFAGPVPEVEVGKAVRVRGLIVDQNYGVWRVWVYGCSAESA